jgi:hypothetical protein
MYSWLADAARLRVTTIKPMLPWNWPESRKIGQTSARLMDFVSLDQINSPAA